GPRHRQRDLLVLLVVAVRRVHEGVDELDPRRIGVDVQPDDVLADMVAVRAGVPARDAYDGADRSRLFDDDAALVRPGLVARAVLVDEIGSHGPTQPSAPGVSYRVIDLADDISTVAPDPQAQPERKIDRDQIIRLNHVEAGKLWRLDARAVLERVRAIARAGGERHEQEAD